MIIKMKLQKGLILSLMLIIGLIPLPALASNSVTVNAISPIHPGDSVTLAGSSTYSEVIIKVLRPSNSVVFYTIAKVTDGQYSSSFTLASSEAAGTYKVVAGQASTVAVQDIIVEANTPPNPASSNADLSGLVLSSGTLAFTSGTLDYTVDVANSVSSLIVTASVSDRNATMTVNGIAVASGQPSNATSLIVGSNAISIVVTAQNGISKKTYTVNVNRAQGTSSNADLSGLALSSGTLAFTSGTLDYTVDVANSVSSMIVTASVSDRDATMTVNGIAVASGQPSSATSLIVGSNAISIVVTAQNGTSKKTYTVNVNRAQAKDNSSGSGGSMPPTTSIVTSTDGKLTLPVGKAGEVKLENAVTISIPVGAIDKELKLTIEKLLDTQKLLTNKEVLASPIYEILKNFTQNFSKPVTLTLSFDPAIVKNGQRPAIFYYDEVKKEWVEVTGGKVNVDRITVDIDHFTKFAVFAVGQPTTVPTPETKPTINFSDISGHWAEANIKQAVSSGIVTGYPDGTFKPNHTVTRAEFAVMLMNTLKLQGEGATLTFTDATKIGAWAQKAVAQAVQAGIINGYEDGSFRPDAEITRAEMAAMLANALGQSSAANVATGFADDEVVPSWAKGAVAAVKKLGIVEGQAANVFAPNAQTTRAEAVTVMLKMLTHKSK